MSNPVITAASILLASHAFVGYVWYRIGRITRGPRQTELRSIIAGDIRAWSEVRTSERVPHVCDDADEGYCHHDGAFTAYALAARIAEGKLLVEPYGAGS